MFARCPKCSHQPLPADHWAGWVLLLQHGRRADVLMHE
jgi:hypothetical protein